MITIFILGFLFGAILQYAKLNKYDTISGLAIMKNLAVAKSILITIGVGAILLSIEIELGFASYHIKSLILGGVMLGGLIFGTGMAILGYCPGTLPVSLGEGSLDALVGIIGGLVAGLVYTILLPSIHGILGPDFGNITLKSIVGANTTLFFILVFVIGAIFIGFSFWLHKLEKVNDLKWLFAGVALAILNGIVFLTIVTDRILGASTAYPYLSDLIAGTTGNEYFAKIKGPGQWELIFLAGAVFSGLVLSLIRKDFKLVLIHKNWKVYKGDSPIKRIIWAFVGGFLIIIGSRMAGGCTSGHIISGGMQLAVSSLLFTFFVFTGLLVTGRLFYRTID